MRKFLLFLFTLSGLVLANSYDSFVHLNDRIYRCYIGGGQTFGRLDVTDIQTGEFKRFWCAELGVSFSKDGATYSCGGFTSNGEFVNYEMAFTKIMYKGKVSNYDITVDECFKSVDKEKIDPCKKK